MKAQQQVLTPLLIILIMIAIVSSVYFWGVPLIEKNRDITILRKAEDFMKNLNEKIKYVANTRSRESIEIEVGTLTFDPSAHSIKLEVDTKGTIYSVGGDVYFVRNVNETGVWGRDEPELLWVRSIKVGNGFHTIYNLRYRTLIAEGIGRQYKIVLTSDITTPQMAGKGHTVEIEYKGMMQENQTVLTFVGIKVV